MFKDDLNLLAWHIGDANVHKFSINKNFQAVVEKTPKKSANNYFLRCCSLGGGGAEKL